MSPRIGASLAVVTLLFGLVSCSTKRDADEPLPSDGETRPHETAPATLPDRVTTADYEEAVGRLERCLAESDIELINDGWDPVDHERMILHYRAPGMPEEELHGTFDECRARHLDALEERYNEQNEPYMAPNLLAAIKRCLASRDIPFGGDEKNPDELLRAVPEESHDDLFECAHKSALEEYPSIAITFP